MKQPSQKDLRKVAKQSPVVQAMFEQISKLPHGQLEFKISTMPNGDWMAESVNPLGILTGGSKDDDMDAMIEDATLTYFEIPREYCSAIKLFNAGEKKRLLLGKRITYYPTVPNTATGA